jgi:hypothetical protein
MAQPILPAAKRRRTTLSIPGAQYAQQEWLGAARGGQPVQQFRPRVPGGSLTPTLDRMAAANPNQATPESDAFMASLPGAGRAPVGTEMQHAAALGDRFRADNSGAIRHDAQMRLNPGAVGSNQLGGNIYGQRGPGDLAQDRHFVRDPSTGGVVVHPMVPTHIPGSLDALRAEAEQARPKPFDLPRARDILTRLAPTVGASYDRGQELVMPQTTGYPGEYAPPAFRDTGELGQFIGSPSATTPLTNDATAMMEARRQARLGKVPLPGTNPATDVALTPENIAASGMSRPGQGTPAPWVAARAQQKAATEQARQDQWLMGAAMSGIPGAQEIVGERMKGQQLGQKMAWDANQAGLDRTNKKEIAEIGAGNRQVSEVAIAGVMQAINARTDLNPKQKQEEFIRVISALNARQGGQLPSFDPLDQATIPGAGQNQPDIATAQEEFTRLTGSPTITGLGLQPTFSPNDVSGILGSRFDPTDRNATGLTEAELGTLAGVMAAGRSLDPRRFAPPTAAGIGPSALRALQRAAPGNRLKAVRDAIAKYRQEVNKPWRPGEFTGAMY